MDFQTPETFNHFQHVPNKKIEVINIHPSEVENIYQPRDATAFVELKDGTRYFADADNGYFSCNKPYQSQTDEISTQIKIDR